MVMFNPGRAAQSHTASHGLPQGRRRERIKRVKVRKYGLIVKEKAK